MPEKEAVARIKINKMLEASGWRFFADANGPANVRLELSIAAKSSDLEALGENFQQASKGFVDFLLLDQKGFPLVVLEAKAESKNPLNGKEQARKYARTLNCRFVILSNGNLHYFWDLERGNPHIITAFPRPESVGLFKRDTPDPSRLVNERIEDDYVVLTQRPQYASEAAWKNTAERAEYIEKNKLCFLRRYQVKAVQAIQKAVEEGRDRFLFEMATGTGKTLTAAAVIKLFLRTRNVSRVLFLVDRLELETQAWKAFVAYLSADYKTVIYKENREDWRRAEIVVSTVQSLLFNNKYQRQFSPTDFDLVISDEAHRSIGGNSRAVFDFFVGYKLGLTATPRDYLKRFDRENPTSRDPREAERRLLLDTYRTFGCETGQPTFRYSLLDGVQEGFLINPTVVDARSEITTTLLSEEGFVVSFTDDTGEDQETAFKQRQFEKQFFSENTNQLFCKVFLENALRDPISGEIGKGIIFGVSQHHASKLVQILNKMADRMFPGRYQSDFAVQVTSSITDAQQFTINFANNTLLGSANFLPTYRTSKARICVTVGMMSTGYDCPDILNLGLFRPVFSPTDFIQIKGRGTRRHNFLDQLHDPEHGTSVTNPRKTSYKLFDFFANCEFFEEEFDYDEVIKLPRPATPRKPTGGADPGEGGEAEPFTYEHLGDDLILALREQTIGAEGMKIDRMLFARFEDTVKNDEFVAEAVRNGQWDRVIDYVNREVFDKPEDYYSLDKLRKAASVDRRLTLREILEKVFGLIPGFKSKDELLEEEFSKFITDHTPEPPETAIAIKHFFKAYITNGQIRHIIDTRAYTDLATNPVFSTRDLKAVPPAFRSIIPNYVKDYVSLNQFAP